MKQMGMIMVIILMCNCANISKTPESGGKLVTTDWLEKNLNDTSLILFYIGSEA